MKKVKENIIRWLFRNNVLAETSYGSIHCIQKKKWINMTQEEREKYIYIGVPHRFDECVLVIIAKMFGNYEMEEDLS